MTWERTATAEATVPPEEVWDVLLDGRRWALWNPGVEWMWLEGDPQAGTLATVKLARVRQTAFVVEEASAPQRFAIGVTVGPVARMRLTWTIAARDSGARIDAAISIAGVFGRLLLERSAERVAAALPAHLDRLAARAAQLHGAHADQKNTRLI